MSAGKPDLTNKKSPPEGTFAFRVGSIDTRRGELCTIPV